MQKTPGSPAEVHEGLEGVVATTSRICLVDGQEGRMLYQGYDIHDLAEHATFEEVAHLLWRGDLPTRSQLAQLGGDLVRSRPLPEPVMRTMQCVPLDTLPIDILRTGVCGLRLYEP